MITFHKVTQVQYDKLIENGTTIKDGLYFITDTGVIKLHNEGGSVTTFGTSVQLVSDFPDANNVIPYCIYTKEDTKQQRIWTGTQWQVLSYPITPEITEQLADENATVTVPNTQAVYKFVSDQVAAAQLGVQIKLHTPVYSLEELQNLPLSGVEDKCMILVETAGLYRYDAQARDNDDPDTDAVVTPKEIQESVPEGDSIDFYPGRWIKMLSNLSFIKGDGINIELNPNDLNRILSLNVNSEQFEFDAEGRLTLKPGSDIVSSKVDKIYGRPDELPLWNNDGSQRASGYKINTTSGLTSLSTNISPDSVISTFVHDITDNKLDDIVSGSGGKIIIGDKNRTGKVKASTYNVGTDFDDLTPENILDVARKKVATQRAVKWYIDRSLSFNPDTIGTSLSTVVDYGDEDDD